MNEIPLTERVFRFKLAPWLPACYASNLGWLKHLLERLGSECTLAAWQSVCQEGDDGLLHQILSSGWAEVPVTERFDAENRIAGVFAELYPTTIAGVSPETARQLVESMPPLPQIKYTFSSLNLWKEITAYEALHLRFDGPARLAEALLERYGKQGELIIYDILRQQRIRAGGGKTSTVAEFITDFTSEPAEANLFTAGLVTELASTGEREVVLHVRQCEWARYFQERHPRVGYLMACSTDEAAYRAMNENLRLQRTSTIMEGGEVCDFRIYAADSPPVAVWRQDL